MKLFYFKRYNAKNSLIHMHIYSCIFTIMSKQPMKTLKNKGPQRIFKTMGRISDKFQLST